MKVARGCRDFDVEDDENTASWQFWPYQFAGRWEHETFQVLDEHLDPDRDFLDIGAWVGPFTLWAAAKARRVVAVEPDPVALQVLTSNVARNRLANVTIVPAAVAATSGVATLTTAGSWGDSMSSLVRDGVSTEVTTVTLDGLLADLDPSIVKVDIEGGESLILPAIGDLLDTGCPVILALHWPWVPDPQPVRELLARCTVTELDPHPDFPTVLVTR